MTLALVQRDTNSIIKVYPDGVLVNINISGLYQSYGVGAGWTSPDNNYALVQVQAFVVPNGQVTSSGPSYAIDGNGNVIETYKTVAAPAPSPAPAVAVDPLAFIGLLTSAEALAIVTAGQTDPQILLFMTMMSAAALIHMDDPRTLGGFQYLKAKGLLTDARIAQIIAGTPPEA